MNVIIFSKGRPAQLELLLRSMKHFAPTIYNNTVVQCKMDTEGYVQVAEIHDHILFVQDNHDGSFKETLLALIDERDPITVFFMDDMCFVHDLDIRDITDELNRSEVVCYSSRLNVSMDYCYTRAINVKHPRFNTWDWRDYGGDFGYPMSLDGHFFKTEEILRLLKQGVYHNPNSLEAWLAAHPIPLYLMSCGDNNAVINNPNNRVQHTFQNRHEGGGLKEINKLFDEGKIIAIDLYLSAHYNAPHVPIEIKMI